jgi:putative ABC transport system ATP-binding protein
MSVLSATDIRKSFREGKETVEVLRGVSLSIDAGEVVALEGPSGSGKTTLLSILGCILTATSGHVIVDGQDVDANKPAELPGIRKKSIGFVFQQYNLFPALTALENVEYALNIKGTKGKAAKEQANAALDTVGLGDRKNYLPRDMSGGQKQRIAIARALVARPAVLLADEPTANLDSQVGVQVLELFRSLAKKEGRGLLIVTHDPKVRTVSDRVIRIRDGLIAA